MNEQPKINESVINDRKMVWWRNPIYSGEILGMRLLRKKSLKQMSRVTGVEEEYLKLLEKDDSGIPIAPPIAGMYMQYLSCTMHHVYQFREILNGEKETFNDSRYVNSVLKEQVYKKCKNKCVACSTENNLHIHHIKEFAKGGTTDLDNLTLLCSDCHADTHKDNNAYYMLKKGAISNE